MTVPTCVRVRAPAKVNLFLAVRGQRADGYHEIVTVFQAVELADEVTIRVEGPAGQGLHPSGRRAMRLTLEHDGGDDVPTDGRNLVLQAAQLLGERLGIATGLHPEGAGPSTRIELAKRIPVAGGMAGGSTDAAATLVGLNEVWAGGLAREELRDLAARLGADVPFCVVAGTAMATGTGRSFARVLVRGTFHWVVAVSEGGLSTPDVYGQWDRVAAPTETEPDAVLAALRTGDASALGAALHNELALAAEALRPGLADGRRTLLEAGALGAVLCGSGPTVLGLARDAADARRIAAEVRPSFDRVLTTSSPCTGPAATPCTDHRGYPATPHPSGGW